MVLIKISDKPTFDLKSINQLELTSLIQGIELMIDNSKNIIQFSEKKQKEVYITAMMSNSNEKREVIESEVEKNWSELKQQLIDNHELLEKMKKRLTEPR